MTERRSFNEIPQPLETLVRYVTTGFYTIECQTIMELMTYYRHISEDDMLKLLQFEKKAFRASIASLKKDKLIQTGSINLKDQEGKSSKLTYYYVNYAVLINAVKYKLLEIRKKVAAMERNTVSMATYQCPSCLKQFNELDVGELYDPSLRMLRCSYCLVEVEETTPKVDCSKNMVKMFNDQFAPFFELLQMLDKTSLSNVLLEQVPAVQSVPQNNSAPTSYEPVAKTTEVNREIVNVQDIPRRNHELPPWIQNNSVRSNIEEPTSFVPEMDTREIIQAPPTENCSVFANEQIQPVNVLLDIGEKSSCHTEAITEDFSSDEEECFTVTLGGRKVPFTEITNEMVAQMTEVEKAEYIKVGQEMHEYYD